MPGGGLEVDWLYCFLTWFLIVSIVLCILAANRLASISNSEVLIFKCQISFNKVTINKAPLWSGISTGSGANKQVNGGSSLFAVNDHANIAPVTPNICPVFTGSWPNFFNAGPISLDVVKYPTISNGDFFACTFVSFNLSFGWEGFFSSSLSSSSSREIGTFFWFFFEESFEQ